MKFKDIIEEFSQTLDDCESFMPGSISVRNRQKQIEKLDVYIAKLKNFKYGAIRQQIGEAADLLFHFQCYVQAFRSYFKIWQSFREEAYQDAWSHLIDSFEYIGIAQKIESTQGIQAFRRRLDALEKSLFPSFARYISAGFTTTVGDCCICGMPFGICEHLENHVYMGRLCRRINYRIVHTDHVALVDTPHDRRCIIPIVENESGAMIDRFTLERTDDILDQAPDSSGGRKIQGIIMTTASLDLD